MNHHRTPAPKPATEETSAYRSHQRREQQIPSFQKPSNTEALERFSETIELLTLNKITKSNAFDNRMIDQLSVIFEELSKNNKVSETVWQKYSAGIDSCGKIYGMCVDFIHTETIKVLGGLNRSGLNDIEVEEEKEEGKVKKKKKHLGGDATLEKNIQAISTTKFDKFDHFDDYFKTMSGKFDVSKTSGLLLNNFMVNSAVDIVLGEESYKGNELECNFRSKLNLDLGFTENQLESEEIFPMLDHFTEKPRQIHSVLLDSINADADLFINTDSEETGIEDELSEEKALNPSYILEDTPDFQPAEPLQLRIQKLSQLDDYRFFTNCKPSTWAGFDYITRPRLPTKLERKPRKKKELPAFQLDENAEIVQDFPPPKRGACNFYSEAAIKKWDENQIALPEDYGYNLLRLTQLFSRPKTFVKSVKLKDDGIMNVIVENEIFSESEQENTIFVEGMEHLFEENKERGMMVASTSKSVDIKKLKETINGELKAEDTFMKVIEKLPKSLPVNEVKQLSLHSCFITMLHLANEKNFRLQKIGECDFEIINNK